MAIFTIVAGCKSAPKPAAAAAVTSTDGTKADASKAATTKAPDKGAVEASKVTAALTAAKGLDASKISVTAEPDGKTITIGGMLEDGDQVALAQKALKSAADKNFTFEDKLKAPHLDVDAGYKKVAAVWAEMTPEQVLPLMKGYTDLGEVANILRKMDEDQVAQILGKMATNEKDPEEQKRAVALCKQLQIAASTPTSA